jgi:hypothetical protein
MQMYSFNFMKLFTDSEYLMHFDEHLFMKFHAISVNSINVWVSWINIHKVSWNFVNLHNYTCIHEFREILWIFINLSLMNYSWNFMNIWIVVNIGFDRGQRHVTINLVDFHISNDLITKSVSQWKGNYLETGTECLCLRNSVNWYVDVSRMETELAPMLVLNKQYISLMLLFFYSDLKTYNFDHDRSFPKNVLIMHQPSSIKYMYKISNLKIKHFEVF